MKLKTYLADAGISLKDFCQIMDCNHSHLSAISTGRRLPSKRLAEDIRRMTGGKVVIEGSKKRPGPVPKPKRKKNFSIKTVENIPH